MLGFYFHRRLTHLVEHDIINVVVSFIFNPLY